MSRQNAVEPALWRGPSLHLDQLRQGLDGAAGALDALRDNPSPDRAMQLAWHCHGLHIAARRLADLVKDDNRQ